MSTGTAEKKPKPEDTSLIFDALTARRPNGRPNPPDDNLYLLTVRQTAKRLQVGINCVYSLTKAERDPLPTVTIGRSIRVPVAALERWLEARTRA